MERFTDGGFSGDFSSDKKIVKEKEGGRDSVCGVRGGSAGDARVVVWWLWWGEAESKRGTVVRRQVVVGG